MRFISYLQEKITDTEDTGSPGKKFEAIFSKALELVGLEFIANTKTGPGWDIKPQGEGWNRLISDKNVNIKVAGTKWMFSASELYSMLPWDGFKGEFNKEKAAAKVKRFLNKRGISDIVFLKPNNKEIEQKIIAGVAAKDTEALEKLLTKKNFYAEKLGRTYDVRILTNSERVTSIALDRKGKVFMRSEKPRNLGGTVTVTFRSPSPKLGKKEKKVKI